MKHTVRILCVAVILAIYPCYAAFACKCVLPKQEIEDAFQESDIVFVGQCVSSEFIVLNESEADYDYVVEFKFKVQLALKETTINIPVSVKTGIGFGDCG